MNASLLFKQTHAPYIFHPFPIHIESIVDLVVLIISAIYYVLPFPIPLVFKLRPELIVPNLG
jgi:hypothetical protein